MLGATIGGLIGGAVGGLIWGLVAYGTGYEIGWIAWGVGLAAGFGASVGAKGNANAATGVIAVVCAVAAILIAKYVVVNMLVDDALKDVTAESVQRDVPGVEDASFWTSCIADQLIEEKVAAGENIAWPGGVEPEYPEAQADYPPAIWTDASARWNALSAPDRTTFRDQHAAYVADSFKEVMSIMRSEAASEGFMASFGAMDLLFGFLAIATAFKVGSSDAPGTEAA
jgi:hypothetical protein